MARPTKLTEDLHENIVQLVRRGNFLKEAAEFCNVDYSTVWRWDQRGEEEVIRLEDAGNPEAEPSEEERPYVEFRNAIRQARAYANIYDQNVVATAAQNDPRWALERMKLRNPSWFRQEVALEVSRPSVEERRSLKRAGVADRALRNTRQQRIGGGG